LDINKEIINIYKEIVEIRRNLHMYPELGYEEVETPKKIEKLLKEMGIETESNIGGNGIVGYLNRGKRGKTIALRADFDALPIQEKNKISYSSKNNGKMHACGHDGHTAILLGAAKLLSKQKEELQGEIRFLFQPAEEKAPVGGALAMIEDGAIDDVDRILGLHIWPTLEKNKIFFKKGAEMASSDPLKIKIYGVSSHASEPENGIDSTLIGAQVLNNLQTIISRNIGPLESGVITIGKFTSGKAYNVISDEAILEGTVRTLNAKTKTKIKNKIYDVVQGICSAHGAKCEIEYTDGYTPVVVNEDVFEELRNSIIKNIGKDFFKELESPFLGGEDFGRYLEKVPGALVFLGSKDGNSYPLHHPNFNFDENIMKLGVKFFITSVKSLLNN